MSKLTTVRIICLGNPLHGDDAVGFHALRLLKQYAWPDGVELVDGGIGGITLLPLFRNCNKVILVDVCRRDTAEGQTQYFPDVKPSDFQGAEESVVEHGGGLNELFALLPVLISPLPTIDIATIEGYLFCPFQQVLSGEVARALPAFCRKLHQDITKTWPQTLP